MKKIQILGTGCANCEKIAALTEITEEELGLDFELEKVSDMDEILKHDIMSTPALVVDGIVKVSGRLPGPDELESMLR